MKIINLDQIKEILDSINIIPTIEKGFVAYSNGDAVIPSVGELIFNNPPGDVHIKYGYIKSDDYYVIKIASGFYRNPELNLKSSNGMMLIFNQKTGVPLGILLDEGYLTDIRTAAAGAIAAKYLAPSTIQKIGILGTGIQARLQLLYLQQVTDCRNAMVWGRNIDKLKCFQSDMQEKGFSVSVTQVMEEITSNCNLIVTTTPATSPLLWGDQIQKGTHITAVGTDSAYKQELDSAIFKKADVIVADSIVQCIERGDIAHAIRDNVINKEKLVELGNILSGINRGRMSDEQITVADLTGVAVQDIAIAKLIYDNFDSFII